MTRAPQVDANLVWATAESLAKRDIPVLPVNPQTKAPLPRHGVKEASTDTRQLGRWWRDYGHDAGLAVATGNRAGFDALDVDPKNGGDRSLRALMAKHGRIADTTTQTTPSGGEHRLFKYREDNRLINRHGGNLPENARVDLSDDTKPAPGLDCRTTGGYILVPPSPGYQWRDKVGSKESLADWPDWLKQRFQQQDRQQALNLDVSRLSPSERERCARQAKAIVAYAARDIEQASVGEQETKLNDRALRIGRAASSGLMDREEALQAVIDAGMKMTSDPHQRPWTQRDIQYKARRAFTQGFNQGPPNDLNWHSGDRRRDKAGTGGRGR